MGEKATEGSDVMRRQLLVVAVVLAVALAAFLLLRSPGGEGEGLKVSGTIEITSVDLSFKTGGRVRERLVDEGEMVRPGQTVARLEDDDLAAEVAVRRARLEEARQALMELEAGSRPEELEQAEAAVARAQAEATRLADDLRRQQALYTREVVPKQKLDAAQAAADTSRAQLEEARAARRLVRIGPRSEQISQAAARLRQARESLRDAETRLGYAVLKAPLAGVVMSRNVEAGEQVSAGTPVVTVGDFGDTWLRAYIAETDMGRVKVGQRVLVTTDTDPAKRHEGRISFIAPEAEFTPKNVQTEKERVKLVYRIKVALPNPAMELKPGMPADAEIQTGDRRPGTGP
jgi:HlyD family secretion protein